MISYSSSTASSAPATSAKVVLGMSLFSILARDLPKPKPIRAPPCMRENIMNKPTSSSSGST